MKKHSLLLLSMIILSSVLVACVGMFLKFQVLEPLGIHREESVIALPFVVLADSTLQYQINRNYDEMMNPTEPPTEPPTVPTEPVETEPVETEPPTTAPTEPVWVQLDPTWFNDALFIGESRSTGMRDVARLGEADYFCKGSMSVFTVQSWTCSDRDFKEKTLRWVLENNTYGKIFIHLGLNEIATDIDLVMEQYQSLIDLVRELQPDAYIILQACMSMTEGKASSPMFPIENLKELNVRLKAIVDAEPEVFRFSDVNTWLTDENGYMLKEFTSDGCHLYGTGYIRWSEWLMEDAGWYGIP